VGDFIELLIFLAVVFFSLLAGGAKKRRTGTGRAASSPPRPPRPPQTRPTQVPREALPEAPSPREGVARELLELLGAQLPEPVAEPQVEEPPPPFPEAVSLERTDFKAESLESLQPAGDKDHDLFHQRYVDAPQEPAKPETPRAHFRRLTPKTARQAVIWKTILSPPKGWD
jgi:hypothetical protein